MLWLWSLACQPEDPGPTDVSPKTDAATGTETGADTAPPGTTPTETAADTAGDTGRATETQTGPWGAVTLAWPGRGVAVADLAAGPDGATWIVGRSWADGAEDAPEAAVVRLDPAGRPDPAFDGDGLLLLSGTAATAVAVAADGTCFVAGVDPAGGDATPFVTRLDPTGAAVAPFGTVPLDLEAGPELAVDLVAPAAGGALLLRGGATGASTVRLTDAGALDPVWGAGGVAPLPVTVDCAATTLCDRGTLGVLTDGAAIGVIGAAALAVKLDPTGAQDRSYGTGGVAVSTGPSWMRGAQVLPDGRLWVTGATVDVDGFDAWAQSMGADGVVGAVLHVDLGAAGLDPADIAEDAAGRLVLVGRVEESGLGRPAIVRTDAAGIADPAFGTDGIFGVDPATSEVATLQAVDFAPDGTILAAGDDEALAAAVAVATDGS
ncbi:MAG: hypothetical protein R3F59_18175 [Myxococcota bacterium]